ncbi:hypothetical protein MMC31_001015 [Peltigera leucophlebia]|nr:hypothetical protein [Peltigera leucophlebia]
MHLPIAVLASCLPQLLSILFGALFLSSFEVSTALASPAYEKFSTGARIHARDDSDYPSDEDIAKNCKVDADKSVFFSQIGDSTPAYNFAKDNGKIIFRQAFPPKYTTKNKRSDKWYQDFCDRFSRIFAEKSAGTVYFVAPWNEEIDDCRVWKRIEYKALVNNAAVHKIVQVNYKDFSQRKNLWVRSNGAPFMSASTTSAPTHGWCGIHVVQYQKPNPATDHYKLDVSIIDANGALIGKVVGADAPAGVEVDVKSTLPNVLVVTTGKVDHDAVLFKYGAQAWGSNDQQHHCDFGAYDSGKREGDCGFSC